MPQGLGDTISRARGACLGGYQSIVSQCFNTSVQGKVSGLHGRECDAGGKGSFATHPAEVATVPRKIGILYTRNDTGAFPVR